MKIGTVEVELKPKDIEGIKNKIKEDLINEGFVNVVRCKDCKHLYKDGKCPLRTWFTHDYDDYCSYGERKDNE